MQLKCRYIEQFGTDFFIYTFIFQTETQVLHWNLYQYYFDACLLFDQMFLELI